MDGPLKTVGSYHDKYHGHFAIKYEVSSRCYDDLGKCLHCIPFLFVRIGREVEENKNECSRYQPTPLCNNLFAHRVPLQHLA